MLTGVREDAQDAVGRLDLEAYRTPDRLAARIEFHRRYPGAAPEFHEWLFTTVLGNGRPPADARVLEVGAGTGKMWVTNACRVPPGWRLTATDLSAGMVAACRDSLANAGLTARTLEADVHDLPFAAGSFDLVFANHMLYHLTNRRRGLAELKRVLAPGGTLVAATNGRAHLSSLRSLVRPLLEEAERLNDGRAPEDETLGSVGAEPLGFTLEDGSEELERLFVEVETHRRDDSVRVGDPLVVLAYLRSMLYLPPNPSSRLTAVLAAWEERVRSAVSTAPLVVERSSGFFLAQRGPEVASRP